MKWLLRSTFLTVSILFLLGLGLGYVVQMILQASFIEQERTALLTDSKAVRVHLEQVTMESQEIGSLRTMGSQSLTMKEMAREEPDVSHDKVSKKLAIIQGMFDANGVYIINAKGKIIAHETLSTKKSLGSVVDWRPYFKTAMLGHANLYPAIGSKSGERGLYFAAPIHATGEFDSPTIGVVMLKQGIHQIQKVLNEYAQQGIALLVSPQGVVFAASDDGFKSKILGHADDALLASLRQGKQFGNWFNEVSPEDVSLPVAQESRRLSFLDQDYVFDKASLDLKDARGYWQVYVLRPATMPLGLSMILLLYLVFPLVTLALGLTARWVWREREKGLALQRVASNKIAETASFMQQLLNTLPNPIFYKDEQGRFLGFNKAYNEVFGVNSDTLIGKSVLDLDYLPLKDREAYHQEDMRFIQTLSSLVREQDMTFHDNQVHNTLYSVNAFAKQDGAPGGLIGIFTDITPQKEMETHLREVHRQIRDSIEYGSLIQHTLLPDYALFETYFPSSFVYWEPKDTVGGDIYFLESLGNDDECFLMMIDCTGHGVPGAFVTMLVKAIERQMLSRLMNSDMCISPAEILSTFNKSMRHLLKQDCAETSANAGFDGGIVYVNKATGKLLFSGAETSLFYRSLEQGVVEIKGNRHSIGYRQSDNDYVFTDHELTIESGLQVYLTTDGYLDQNGGEKGFPLGKKRFAKLLDACQHLPLNEQKAYLVEQLAMYQGNNDRNDDVTLVSFRF